MTLRAPPSPEEIRRDFDFYFRSGDLSRPKTTALSQGLRECCVRGLCWRVFLGVLPPSTSEWHEAMIGTRQRYEDSLSENIIDPDKGVADPNVDNPLAQSTDSTWTKFWSNKELESMIQQDLNRLYTEYDVFQEDVFQARMRRILLIYARNHPETSYQQGMHELLAPVLFITDQEKFPPCEGDLLAEALDERYVEHDAAALFESLMGVMKSWFHSKHDTAGAPHRARIRGPKRPPSNEFGLLDDLSALTGKREDPPDAQSPVVIKCRQIFALLAKTDQQLFMHIQDRGIEPQLFLLRWIRLLFGREFHLLDAMVLWDGLFADSPTLELIDYTCLAMLAYIRDDLLSRDYVGCLRRLMKYPPVEDVSVFIQRAMNLRNPPKCPTAFPAMPCVTSRSVAASPHPPLRVRAPPPPPREAQPAMPHPLQSQAEKSPPLPAARTFTLAPAPPQARITSLAQASKEVPRPARTAAATGLSKEQLVEASYISCERELRNVKQTMGECALRLGSLAASLQEELMEHRVALPEDHTLDLKVAQLKQIRDVLRADLPHFFDETPEAPACDLALPPISTVPVAAQLLSLFEAAFEARAHSPATDCPAEAGAEAPTTSALPASPVPSDSAARAHAPNSPSPSPSPSLATEAEAVQTTATVREVAPEAAAPPYAEQTPAGEAPAPAVSFDEGQDMFAPPADEGQCDDGVGENAQPTPVPEPQSTLFVSQKGEEKEDDSLFAN
eukprot:gnl/Trimastix_PCT/2944.p1 GENE.gnl/Trimastix_PCT/2944~~gnl/Trimastix_PCT/2944.p1  ORF type:complete len:729 (-),score=222.48 gnl/Trimastix_PCT/2944:104-2290(-)